MRTIQKIFILILMVIGCTKEDFDQRAYPQLQTQAVTDISEEGATFNAIIKNAKSTPVLDHGFLWRIQFVRVNSSVTDVELGPAGSGYLNKISLGAKEEVTDFQAKINYALAADTPYLVRSYIVTEDFTVYGNTVVFESKGSSLKPEIIDFNPKAGTGGDTITIQVKNFSAIAREIRVFFGPFESKVIQASYPEIKCIVPFNVSLPNVNLYVQSLNIPSQPSVAKFEFKKPVITSLSLKRGTFGEQMVIYGKDFDAKFQNNIVRFGTNTAPIISGKTTELVVKIPDSLNQSPVDVSVTSFAQTVIAEEKFELTPPIINNVTPLEMYTGEVLYLSGKYFSPIISHNKVNLGNAQLKPNQYDFTTSQMGILVDRDSIYEKRNFKVNLEIAGQTASSTNFVKLKGFIRKPDIPEPKAYMTGFQIAGKGYTGFGYGDNNTFWQFNPTDNKWRRMADFEGKARYFPAYFIIGNKAYVGGGMSIINQDTLYRDFWMYDASTDSWQSIKPFPGDLSRVARGFAANGKGYVCQYNNPLTIWEYNPQSDEWLKKAAFSTVADANSAGLIFVINNFAYIYVLANPYDGFYIYNITTNTIERDDNRDWDLTKIYDGFAFSQNEKGYIFRAREGFLMEYNPASRASTLIFLRGSNYATGAFGFNINNLMYLGGSGSITYPTGILWEYELE